MRKEHLALGVLVCAIVLVAVGSVANRASANPDYLQAFRDRYPQSTLPDDTELQLGSACFVCHNSNVFFGDWNCYRKDLIARLRQGRTIQEALADIEPLDSDGDGAGNLTEILTPRSTTQIGYNPGLVGPLGIDPCLPPGTLPVTNRLETPPAIGACCAGSTCIVQASSACVGSGRRFAGAGAVCNPPGNLAQPCCAADFDQTGSIGIDDIFGFLNAWFASSSQADINRDTLVTVDDIFVFLNAWFTGC